MNDKYAKQRNKYLLKIIIIIINDNNKIITTIKTRTNFLQHYTTQITYLPLS